MSFDELVIVIGGLVLGYWLVSFFFGQKPKFARRPEPGKEPPPTGGAQRDTPPPQDPPPEPEQQSEPPRNSAAWYEVLEISPRASATEIRAAYRSQMSKYHPDKVAALGKELKEVAERKTKEIGEAYKVGMRIRGANP